MKKVTWFKNRYSLSEESQPKGILFSFLSAPRDGFKQCHPWVKCRDFLHDAVRAALNKNSCSIYGFNYGPKKAGCAPLDLRRMRIMVSHGAMLNSDDAKKIAEFDLKMRYAKKLINFYEKLAGVGYTKLAKFKDGTKNFWVFNGPSFWLKSPSLVSLFTLLIRLGHNKIEFDDEKELLDGYKKLSTGSNVDKDGRYLQSIANKIHTVIERAPEVLIDGKRFDKDYYADIPIGTFHNNAGIVSLCRGNYINKAKSTTINSKK